MEPGRADIPELVLYTRADCHLCEVAAELLDSRRLPWRLENIDTDLDLIRRYGRHVPVLYRTDTGKELFWPFNDEALQLFVNATL